MTRHDHPTTQTSGLLDALLRQKVRVLHRGHVTKTLRHNMRHGMSKRTTCVITRIQTVTSKVINNIVSMNVTRSAYVHRPLTLQCLAFLLMMWIMLWMTVG